MIFIFAVIGALVGYFLRKYLVESKLKSAKFKAEQIILDAEKEAESTKKEILISAKEQAHKMTYEAEREISRRQAELQKIQQRIGQREDLIDKKLDLLEKKENNLRNLEQSLEANKKEIEKIINEQTKELEKIAHLTSEEAKRYLLERKEKELKKEYAMLVRSYAEKVREESSKKAKEIIALAIQRCSVGQITETSISTISLPSDELKGRIIGREGRNIRAFENLTGVEIVIDDTPGVVVISSFDPIRREIAKITLESLISDGRIQPARIEEKYEKAKSEVEAKIVEQGEKALIETRITGVHPELIKLLGRLYYRTSYGQNVLMHSIEVSQLAGLMAAELEVDVHLATRAGLFHDIGKAVDFEIEGTHSKLGAELARRYKESLGVIHAILAHHGEEEPKTIEAILVSVADTISGARPGARKETLESYIQRLTKLEKIALNFDGIEKAYAIQAGREIRVFVKPEVIDDDDSYLLARDIAKAIESELTYPGQIKVNVIREIRAVDYAK